MDFTSMGAPKKDASSVASAKALIAALSKRLQGRLRRDCGSRPGGLKRRRNSCAIRIASSFLRDGFVQIQERAGNRGVGGQFHRIEFHIGFHLADRDQSLRGGTVEAETLFHAPPARPKHAKFRIAWLPASRQPESVADA